MLDLHTLQKCVDWFKVRRAQIPTKGKPEINSQTTIIEPIHINQDKIHLMDDLIHELDSKRADIECAMETEKDSPRLTICPHCGAKRSVYKVFFSQIHLRIIQKIFEHCVKNKTHEINKRDIPGLTHTDYGNFCFLQMFGLLYYLTDDKGKKLKGGQWGVAVKRIYQFLHGEYAVAEYSMKDTRDKTQKTSENRIYIGQIKKYTPEQLQNDHTRLLPYFVKYLEDNQEV